jgi:hypothetical protein
MTTANTAAAGTDCGHDEALRSSADGSLLKTLEPAPEKWISVLRKNHAQTKRQSGMTIRRKVVAL